MNKDEKTMLEKLARDYRHEFEVRSILENEPEDDGFLILEGKATPFNNETVLFNIGDTQYKEEIDARAFDNADMSDVVFKYNHSSHVVPVARTRNRSLELMVKEDGLYMRAKLDKKVPAAVELYESVRSGLLDRMSFAFSIEEESYNENEHKWYIKKIRKVFDVAAVDFPAYDNTVIHARRLQTLEGERIALESENERRQAEALKLKRLRAKSMTK